MGANANRIRSGFTGPVTVGQLRELLEASAFLPDWAPIVVHASGPGRLLVELVDALEETERTDGQVVTTAELRITAGPE